VSVIAVDAAPGAGPALHRHPYEEVFVVLEGEATFTLGDETRVARAGEIVVAPANVPHAFKNAGGGRLRQVDIHVNPRFETEWLD
jgi:quercetin dioxygenase-like cupin family protein